MTGRHGRAYRIQGVKIATLALSTAVFWAWSLAISHSQEASTATSAGGAPVRIGEFFRQLVFENLGTYQSQNGSSYVEFCETYDLDPGVAGNRTSFHVVSFLHDLFTCSGPLDCVRGGILDIPYMWHWIDPNPRHAIRRVQTGTLLVEETPPERFARYRSFADVDRVPSLYFADLVTETPQYEHPSCGSMYTFGWCSEREMAFCLLAQLFELDGWIQQVGNHVWSMFPIEWQTRSGDRKRVILRVDNTYDQFGWREYPGDQSLEAWIARITVTPDQRWYNAQAHDADERARVLEIDVPWPAQRRIRAQVQAALE